MGSRLFGGRSAIGRAVAGIPARAKVAVRPHLIPLRRFLLAPLEEELRQMRSQIDELKHSTRIVVGTGAGDVMVQTSFGFVMCSSSDPRVLAELAERGELDRGTRILMQRILQPRDVYVEMGTEVSFFALVAARTLGTKGQIHCLPTSTMAARLLRDTVIINKLSDVLTVDETYVSHHDDENSIDVEGIGSGAVRPRAGQDAADLGLATLERALVDLPAANLMMVKAANVDLALMKGAESLFARSPGLGLIVEFDLSFRQPSQGWVPEWLNWCKSLGFASRIIDSDTGRLKEPSSAKVIDVGAGTLIFARPDATLWLKAGTASPPSLT